MESSGNMLVDGWLISFGYDLPIFFKDIQW